MRTNFRLLALVLAIVALSFQCTKNNDETPSIPTIIDHHFKPGSFTNEGKTLNYQECHFQPSLAGDAALVVVLHGQYANGSDNESQLHQDAMIKIWHYLSTSNMKAIMLAPQCPTGYEWDENPSQITRQTMPELLKAAIDEYIKKQPNIDPSRIYILGYSDAYKPAGGGGAWRMLNEYPDMFAGAMIVAADPDEAISPAKIAKTPVMLVKGESDIYAVSMALETFADMVHDAGGILREEIIQIGSREDLCREAFTEERLDWVMQYTKQ
jgi:predicted peptidase